MKRTVDLLAALAEPTRLAALRLVWDGREHCVCELMERLGATQSRMSRHMSVLEAAGLVAGRRDRQWVRYTRARDLPAEVAAVVDAALALVEVAAGDGTAAGTHRAAGAGDAAGGREEVAA